MMKKTALVLALLGVMGSAQAASFLNGGFESSSASDPYAGWTTGSGYNYGSTADSSGNLALDPANYTGTGAWAGALTQATALDPITGLSEAKYGAQAVRINDSYQNYSVNVIKQSVSNYDGTSINFAWAAVLQGSHGITDSDIFGLKITDKTTGKVLYNATYSSASADLSSNSSLFKLTSSGWYYNDWTEVSLNVTQGHDYEVVLLASDCPYGGHAGYVYLDGFGTVQGGGGDNGTGGNSVPEPGTLLLAGAGLIAAAGLRRRKTI